MTEKYKRYEELSPDELYQIKELIIKGGEVNVETLSSRLEEVELIGYAENDNQIVATASIKNPLNSYVVKVFLKAGNKCDPKNFKYELGYVMVNEKFRKDKLASKLCYHLCETFNLTNIFATTKIENMGMLSILEKNSFKKVGQPYLNNDKSAHLQLLIKQITQ